MSTHYRGLSDLSLPTNEAIAPQPRGLADTKTPSTEPAPPSPGLAAAKCTAATPQPLRGLAAAQLPE